MDPSAERQPSPHVYMDQREYLDEDEDETDEKESQAPGFPRPSPLPELSFRALCLPPPPGTAGHRALRAIGTDTLHAGLKYMAGRGQRIGFLYSYTLS